MSKQFPTAVSSWVITWYSLLRPPQDDLSNDPELAGRYIILSRVDCHASWVSKPVLELMMTSGKIPEDIDGGEIIRDRDGVPTGITLGFNPP